MSKVKTEKLSAEQIVEIAGAIHAKKVALSGLTKREAIQEKARIRRIKRRKSSP